MGDVPRKVVLNESIRNLYFHVPMWFGMILILGASAYHSIRYLIKPDMLHDTKADSTAKVGVLFSLLGMATGMVWAQFTWGAWWSGDPKQNTSAIAILIYLAYLVLRGSFNEEQQRARISAVYNVLAFACLIPLLFILPRLTDSLHPGNGGNPGFGAYDLDNRMRMVFYPAVIGWTLLGFWIASLRTRIITLEQKEHE
jgi:heme exporter protein C